MMTYEELWRPLAGTYGDAEAKAIVRLVLDMRFGLSMADIICGKVTQLSAHDQQELQEIHTRLLAGEPVQYVLGEAEFGGRRFDVSPGVLIPRPETYELCRLVVQRARRLHAGAPLRLLDVGTGSGCIACTLAAELPAARVTAWDVSHLSLDAADRNASRLGVRLTLERHDALCATDDGRRWDVIVSNPPYVCEREKADMARHVLDWEPAEALFVPDDDPLRFYTAIGRYALQTLTADGCVAFEVNAALADDTRRELLRLGYGHVSLTKDQYGKDRFIMAARH